MADNAENLRQADLAKLPFFKGAKSDAFTCEMWVQGVQRCRDSSNWNNATTMTYVFNALRGEALEWTRTLNRSSVNVDEWASFKKGLLYAFSAVRTSRTTTINLANLQQNQSKHVVSYNTRIINTVNDLEGLNPDIPVPTEPWTAAVWAVPAFMALPIADQVEQLQHLITHGAQRVYDHMALNIFVSNHRPSIREEVIRQSPKMLNDAFEMAMEAEKAQYDSRKTASLPMMPVEPYHRSDTNNDNEDALQAELEELTNDSSPRIEAIKKKLSKFRRPPTGGTTFQQSRQHAAPSTSIPANPAQKNMKCCYCNKKGHIQYDCYNCRRNNAPMIGAGGKPYTPRSNNSVTVNPRSDQVVVNPITYLQTAPQPTDVYGQTNNELGFR